MQDVIDVTLISVPVISKYIAYNTGKKVFRESREEININNYKGSDNISVLKNIKTVAGMLPQICTYDIKEERYSSNINCPLYMAPFFKAFGRNIYNENKKYVHTIVQLNNGKLTECIYSYKALDGLVETIHDLADGNRDRCEDTYYDEVTSLSQEEKKYLNEELNRKLGYELSLMLLYEINKRVSIERRYFNGKNNENRRKLFAICEKLSQYQSIFSQDTIWLLRNFFIAFDVIWFLEDRGREMYFEDIVEYLEIMLKGFNIRSYLEMLQGKLLKENEKIDINNDSRRDKCLSEMYTLFDNVRMPEMGQYKKFFKGNLENDMQSTDKLNEAYRIIQKEVMKNLMGIC